MDVQTSNAGDRGGIEKTKARIAHESPSQAPLLIALVDRKATEDGNGDRVGHVAPEPAGFFCQLYCTRFERVIGNHPIVIAHDERSDAPLAWLVRARRRSQPSDQRHRN